MTLIALKKRDFKWQPGDLITAAEAAALLGYKSAKQLTDPERRARILKDFEAMGCALTCDIQIGGALRFVRAEIDEFLTRSVEAARSLGKEKNMRLAA